MRSPRVLSIVLTVMLTGFAGAASAATFSKTFDFKLDQWYEVEQASGAVTVHRMIVRHQPKNLKSKVFRPGNSEYLATIQIEIEFTNDASRDYEAHFNVRWLDANGEVIDGYNDNEDLDEGERHGSTTITLSTLQYGLDRAKKLSVDIDW